MSRDAMTAQDVAVMLRLVAEAPNLAHILEYRQALVRAATILDAVPAATEATTALIAEVPDVLERLRLAETALVALTLDGVPSHARAAVRAWMDCVVQRTRP